jgi:hypothetical protein
MQIPRSVVSINYMYLWNKYHDTPFFYISFFLPIHIFFLPTPHVPVSLSGIFFLPIHSTCRNLCIYTYVLWPPPLQIIEFDGLCLLQFNGVLIQRIVWYPLPSLVCPFRPPVKKPSFSPFSLSTSSPYMYSPPNGSTPSTCVCRSYKNPPFSCCFASFFLRNFNVAEIMLKNAFGT